MQNKSAIWTFVVLLTLACIYQLSFSWVTDSVEGDAKEYAEQKLDSVMVAEGDLSTTQNDSVFKKYQNDYLLSVAHKEVYPVLGFTYKYCKKNEINLGLDLQGGMNVTLEVSVVDVVKALSGYSNDPAFKQAIQDAKEMQKASQEDFVTLFGRAFEKNNPNAKLAAIFHTRENKEKFPRDATNEEILDIIQEEAESAVDRTEQVIKKRIDNLGVVQPKVQKLETSGRIQVELPGVKDKERVRKILQGTAKLEFWETYENSKIYPMLAEANELLRKRLGGSEEKATENDTTGVETGDESEVADDGADSLTVATADTTEEENLLDVIGADEDTAGGDTTGLAQDQTQSFEEFAKKNPLFGALRPVLVQEPQSGQYYPGKGPVVGYSAIKDTAAVNNYLSRKDVRLLFPPRIKFLWAAKPYDEEEKFLQLYAIEVTSRDGRAPLEGDAVSDARMETDQLGNPEVGLSMNSDGAKKWKLLTKDNIGESVAIVLDDYVYSAPTVQTEISGGRSSISGNFTVEEAEDLANVLKAGKLPAPANIIEEAIVGPSLGEEAIASGLNSFLVALIFILAYMLFYYSRAGAVADVALFANLFFVIGVLASLGATLTLPGIAGIVLTIGMSVDANVLIYERIREELAAGKGLRLALVDGYQNAYSSIIDANLTTLLTGVILFIFGSGPIKGFATTLIIGIITSLFSAIFITRLIFDWQLSKGIKIKFANKITEGAFKNMNVGFIKKRKLYYGISAIIIVLGIASIFVKGFNLGVDFSGGRSYLVRFEQPVNVANIGDKLEAVFVSEDGLKQRPEVKTFGSSNQVKITTKYKIESNEDNIEKEVESKLKEGLGQVEASGGFNIMSSQKVGPTIADDIKASAFWAVLFSLIIIFLYIVLRFRKWQYGLGALAAMTHDVLVVLAIFSIFYGILPFSLEIDTAFIAAVLTVVGYSINDTVVVFDRIREYLGIHKRKDAKEVVNSALNSTLSRTINTSLSTFFVLLMIFIFGGEVIRGFVFALMIGVVVGTYSSLFIASPLVLDLDRGKPADQKKKKK